MFCAKSKTMACISCEQYQIAMKAKEKEIALPKAKLEETKKRLEDKTNLLARIRDMSSGAITLFTSNKRPSCLK
jgi:hypothetical protein